MNRRPSKAMLLMSIAAVVVILGLGYLYLRIRSNVCISEEMKTTTDLPGVKIEVIYTNCDTLAKTEEVCVYFAQAEEKGKSWFHRLRNHRMLVFSYDPGGRAFPDLPLPLITRSSPSTILISIPKVSEVFYQRRDWANMSIAYEIGKENSPANPR